MLGMLPVFSPEHLSEADSGGSSGPSTTRVSNEEEAREDAVRRQPRKRRVLTAARKEQNRVAQRAFRLRRKEQREELKASISSAPCSNANAAKARILRPRLTLSAESRGPTAASTASSDGVAQPSTVVSSSTATESDLPFKDTSAFSLSSVDDLNATDLDLLSFPSVPKQSDTDFIGPLVPFNSSCSPSSGNTSGTSHSSPNSGSPPFQAIADPHANALEFRQTTIFGACLHNALALGFDLDEIANCGSDSISPFYRHATPRDDPASLLASSLLSLTSRGGKVEPLPPDLRPTLNQVLIPHHFSLDLIPLPALRDRAIVLSSAMPHTFNMWELKLDIYERGGLTVMKGVEISRTGRARQLGEFQPWDRRSWVATPWFLKKWCMIVDEETGLRGGVC